ncbi:MAG: hypothetical protein AAGA18_13920 [Verrucomicrobiota bacterium]
MPETYFGPFDYFDKTGCKFLFIFNDVEPDLLEEERDLGWGWSLRRLDWEELERFGFYHHFQDWQRYSLGSTSRLPHALPRYEGNYDVTQLLPVEEWRLAMAYAEEEVGIGPGSLSQALAISDLQLLIGARSTGCENPTNGAHWPQFGGFGIRNRITPVYGQGNLNSAVPFPYEAFENRNLGSKADLNNARQVIEWRRRTLPDHVLEGVFHFLNLDRLQDYEPLKHLGYFSIIDAFLTHPPAEGDRFDSITRQLKKNIKLLEYFMKDVDIKLPFDDFGETGTDKVISKLYAYRSAIAHGGDVATALQKMDDLRPGKTKTNMCWMHDFLRTFTRRILQIAIWKPDLFLVLK